MQDQDKQPIEEAKDGWEDKPLFVGFDMAKIAGLTESDSFMALSTWTLHQDKHKLISTEQTNCKKLSSDLTDQKECSSDFIQRANNTSHHTSIRKFQKIRDHFNSRMYLFLMIYPRKLLKY